MPWLCQYLCKWCVFVISCHSLTDDDYLYDDMTYCLKYWYIHSCYCAHLCRDGLLLYTMMMEVYVQWCLQSILFCRVRVCTFVHSIDEVLLNYDMILWWWWCVYLLYRYSLWCLVIQWWLILMIVISDAIHIDSANCPGSSSDSGLYSIYIHLICEMYWLCVICCHYLYSICIHSDWYYWLMTCNKPATATKPMTVFSWLAVLSILKPQYWKLVMWPTMCHAMHLIT